MSSLGPWGPGGVPPENPQKPLYFNILAKIQHGNSFSDCRREFGPEELLSVVDDHVVPALVSSNVIPVYGVLDLKADFPCTAFQCQMNA
ncbi:hypothetical protein TRICI_002842 [Trichomonascus ciferrii]|uniref:Uncharacterized protein n=1 Tax=Trichomonascus ciferrii TaxID=44093 RepID=A0A642V5R9_9ASCO|nr:hypothetical protein TRICI_002842 [Trichomonascus ciferrii]